MTGQDLHIQFRVKFNDLNTNKNKNLLPEEINLLITDQLKKVVTTICNSESNRRGEGYGDSRLRVDMIQSHLKEDSTIVAEGGSLVLSNFTEGKKCNLPNDYYMTTGIEASTTDYCTVNYRKPVREYANGKELRNVLNNYYYTTSVLSPVGEIREDKIYVYENNFTITAIFISYCKTLPIIGYNDNILPFSDDLWRIVIDDSVTKALAISTRDYNMLKAETQINE